MGQPPVWTLSAPTTLTPWSTAPLCLELRVSTCLLFLSVAPGSAPWSLCMQREHQLHFRSISSNLSNPEPTSSEYTALLKGQPGPGWVSPLPSLLALRAPSFLCLTYICYIIVSILHFPCVSGFSHFPEVMS